MRLFDFSNESSCHFHLTNKKTRFLYLLLLFFVMILFPSCESEADVYVAGYATSEDNGHKVATVWKNGVAQSFPSEYADSEARSIYVSGSDVYVVGSEDVRYEKDGLFYKRKVAKIWKNGVAQNLTDGKNDAEALSVCVSGENVYVVGYEKRNIVLIPGMSKDIMFAKLWKNGEEQKLELPDRGANAEDSKAVSVFVSGEDVYVTGNNGSAYRLKLWKNGVAQYLSEENLSTESFSIFVSGEDVYRAGIDMVEHKGGGLIHNAKLWKNDTEQKLIVRENISMANAVFVSNDDVYVVGSEYNEESREGYATLWENGKEKRLSGKYTSANSVFVLNNYVYVVGYGSNNEKGEILILLWKNGKEKILAKGSEIDAPVGAYSIFVK
jgi:hypothetical protein